MRINTTIRECAQECGMATYLYARIKEANILLDDVRDYPSLWRQFNDKVRFSKISGVRKRTTTLHFMDQLPSQEPSTEKDVEPIVAEMEAKCHQFLQALKSRGCEVDIAEVQLTPTVEYLREFDICAAGVRCDLTITYREDC